MEGKRRKAERLVRRLVGNPGKGVEDRKKAATERVEKRNEHGRKI